MISTIATIIATIMIMSANRNNNYEYTTTNMITYLPSATCSPCTPHTMTTIDSTITANSLSISNGNNDYEHILHPTITDMILGMRNKMGLHIPISQNMGISPIIWGRNPH